MRTTLALILVVFYSCVTTKLQPDSREDKHYTQAFCELMKAKYQFNTPILYGYNLYILQSDECNVRSWVYRLNKLS